MQATIMIGVAYDHCLVKFIDQVYYLLSLDVLGSIVGIYR